MTSTGGVLTRAISVATDAAVLLVTFLATRSIFELSAEHSAQTTLMSMLLRNGKLSSSTLPQLNIDVRTGFLQFRSVYT